MTVYTGLFVACYLVTLCCYFFSETSGNFNRRATNKIILASEFLVYALVVYFTHYPPVSIHLICMLAIAFSWAGDVMLLYSFAKGGVPFTIGNILFVVYEIVYMSRLSIPFARVWWCIPLFFIMWGSMHVLERRGWLRGKHSVGFVRYCLSTTAHGCLGVAFAVACPTPRVLLLGIGLMLFTVSDYFLALHNFKVPASKTILRLNSGTYFLGLLLIVLSMTIAPYT